MKLVSKRASLVVFVLAIVCLMAQYVLCYWCGYYQKSFTPILWAELLALFGFVLFLAALIAWIASLFQRKQRLWTTTVLAGLISLWMLEYIIPSPHDLILHGMRDGMLRNYSLDEIRRFARDFDQLPILSKNSMPRPALKLYWNRKVDDDLAKTGLKEKYPILANCEAVVESDNIVHVDWGGFENHWGFSVAVVGSPGTELEFAL